MCIRRGLPRYSGISRKLIMAHRHQQQHKQESNPCKRWHDTMSSYFPHWWRILLQSRIRKGKTRKRNFCSKKVIKTDATLLDDVSESNITLGSFCPGTNAIKFIYSSGTGVSHSYGNFNSLCCPAMVLYIFFNSLK